MTDQDREIIADYVQHYPGQREVVDWDRADGTHRNVPVVYLREVTKADYLARCAPGYVPPDESERFYWEVSVD